MVFLRPAFLKLETVIESGKLTVKETYKSKCLWLENVFLYLNVTVALAFIGIDSKSEQSPFRCQIYALQTEDSLLNQCTPWYLPTIICVVLTVITITPKCYFIITLCLRVVQLIGIVWLMFLMESFQHFVHPSLSIGYFGYAILCGVTVADIGSVPKGSLKAQLFYAAFMTFTAATIFIAEYHFSKFVSWTLTSAVLLFLTLLVLGFAIKLISCLEPDQPKGNLQSLPSFSIVGLCWLLLILVPSCQFNKFDNQLLLVVLGSVVYVLRWWISVFNKEVVPVPAISEV